MPAMTFHRVPKPDQDPGTTGSSGKGDNLLRGCLSEFFAMLLFVYFGCGSASSNVRKFANGEWDPASVLIIAMQFGFGITVLAYAFGGSSGGHINCAVTWCLMIVGVCSPIRGFCYLISQLLGSIVGAGLLDLTTNIDESAAVPFAGLNATCGIDRSCGVGANGFQNPWVGEGHAFLAELMSTFLLCIVVLEVAVYPGTSDGSAAANATAPLPIGLAVFMAHVFCIPITGCSINPTRSFGPSLIANSWDNHWIWWIGPLTGATLASIVFFIMHLESVAPLSKAQKLANNGAEDADM